jgi:geranylgeranylglycerol-phosphate geranylgeranyltransferase
VDKVNQPSRPLPSGLISKKSAVYFCTILLILGLGCAVGIGPANFGIAALFALIGWYYNYAAKKTGLFGNSLVALSLAIPYVFGSVAIHNYSINLGYLLALTSFLAGMGREVLKGVADIQGDRIRNVRTVAITKGQKTARRLSATFFLLAVLSSVIPIILGLLGKAFPIYIVLIGLTDAVFVYLSFRVLSMKEDKESIKLKGYALAGMMLGLVAYFLSGIFA